MDQNDLFSVRSSPVEKQRRAAFARLFDESPVPGAELVYSQLSLYLSRQELSRLIVLTDIYRQHVLNAHGVMFEFGTCYGRTAAALLNLRAILEPYNFTRRLVIFDTFTGLAGTSVEDGGHALAKDGAYSSGASYPEHLRAVLDHHQAEAPLGHIEKYEVIVGDAGVTVAEYLSSHPEAMVSLAYFDFDIYSPTKAALEAIRPRLCRNSVLVFDQLNCPEYPGETVALMEVLGLARCSVQRSPLSPWMSFMVCDSL